MRTTLSMLRGEVIEFPASLDPNSSLHEHAIVVELTDQVPRYAWATNTVEEDRTTHRKRGYIFVSEDLRNENRTRQKAVLAEEWLETMLTLQDSTKRKEKKTLKDRIAMIELLSDLQHRMHWHDDDEEEAEVGLGLQHLLLSKQTIIDFVKNNYGLTISTLGQMARDPATASDAGRIIRSAERVIAQSKNVHLDLAELRIQQLLFSQ
ncbi:hypothetical protein [Rhodopirellula europaea]|uniref:hypothetical protein n=1 Tax=Rhodopirellula europaea TaxID=1263866 RepID=UPI003D276E56